MRSAKAVLWSIVLGLALRAGPAAAQRWPVVAEPQTPASPPAAAEPPATPSPPVGSPASDRWYGWQMLITDAGALGFSALALGVSAAHSSDAAAFPPLAVGAGSYLLGGPIVHAAHGHWGRAGASLALRAGLPLLGWMAGLGISEGSCHYTYDHEGCWIGYAAVGLVIGGVAAMILDGALLGRERVAATPRKQPGLAVAPLRDGGALVIAGRF